MNKTTTKRTYARAYRNAAKAMRQARWDTGDINYELDDDVHTFHVCRHCDTHKTRSGKCWVCRAKELAVRLTAAVDAFEATGVNDKAVLPPDCETFTKEAE